MSMKTIKLFLGYLIAIIMLYSCIDDEGNYDYTELKTVVISNVSSNWSTPLGEEYVITPVIEFLIDRIQKFRLVVKCFKIESAVDREPSLIVDGIADRSRIVYGCSAIPVVGGVV